MNSDTLIKYISGDLTKEERRKVYEWICANDENRSEYNATRRLYDIGLWNEPTPKPSRRKSIIGAAAAFAACAAAAFIAGAMIFSGRSNEEDTPFYLRTITAPAGKEIKVELADGTLAWLNSNSTLTMADEDGMARKVYLQGEGYFEVAHDPEHPFIVKTDRLAVKVLGTKFNVNAYPGKEKWETALFDGSVAILNQQEQEVLTIAPGTKVEYRDGSLIASSINYDKYLWREGILYFDNLTTREIIEQLAVFYDLDTDIAPGCRLDRKFTGKFRTVDGYDHILKVLRIDNTFDYTIERHSDTEDITVHFK